MVSFMLFLVTLGLGLRLRDESRVGGVGDRSNGGAGRAAGLTSKQPWWRNLRRA
jgi:hypothetical protein